MPRFLRSILVSLLAILGLIFILKAFLNPRKASINSAPSESQNEEIVPEQQSEELEEVEEVEPSNKPTIALNQPEETILETPKNLERGAELRIYQNVEEEEKPNIASYSPSQIIETNNIALQPGERYQFQVASGYFEIEKEGDYNFLVDIDSDDEFRLNTDRLQIIVDNEPFKRVLGGRANLAPGWHKIELFYNPAYSAGKINAEEIKLKMAEPGEIAETIEVWREAEEMEAQLKNQEVAN